MAYNPSLMQMAPGMQALQNDLPFPLMELQHSMANKLTCGQHDDNELAHGLQGQQLVSSLVDSFGNAYDWYKF